VNPLTRGFKPPVHSEGIRLGTGESRWQHFPRLLLPTSDTLGLMKTIIAGSSWQSQATAGTILGALFLATLVPAMLQAQESFWDSPDAYLGQTPPSDIPKEFAPGQLADKRSFVMGRVAFSRDGKEFYFTQNDSWKSGDHSKLRVMRYADHHWNKPEVIAERFMSPTFSIDGNTLFMRQGGMRNVWQSKRSGSGWSEPAPVLVGAFGVYDFMPTASGTFYAGSDPDPEDVKNGITYAFSVITISNSKPAVKSLGRPLNEPGFNGDLYIAPDESYIIVSAHETSTFESELWISFRKPDLTWTPPVSLGSNINSGLAHRWGQLSPPTAACHFRVSNCLAESWLIWF
jgi:hypothetical protein